MNLASSNKLRSTELVYKPLPSVCPGTEVTRWTFIFEVWSNSELRVLLATDAVLLSGGFPGVDGRRVFSTPTPLHQQIVESPAIDCNPVKAL